MIIGASTTILWDIFLARRVTETWRRWKSKKNRKHLEKVGAGNHERNNGAETQDERRPNGTHGSDIGSATGRSESGKERQERKKDSMGIVMQNTGQGELQRRMSDGGGIAAVPLTDGTTVRNVADEEHKVGGVDGNDSSTMIRDEGTKGECSKQDPTVELSTDMQSHAISIRVGMIVTAIFLGM